MHPKHIAITNYQYELPDNKIAKYPLTQKDNAKLLINNNGKITDDIYAHLDQYLPTNSCLFFNQTKVINARLIFQKASGGKIEIFCLEPDEQYIDMHDALNQTSDVYWKCLVGGASKWKDDAELTLAIPNNTIFITAKLFKKVEGAYIIHFKWKSPELSFASVLTSIGELPIPPYLNRKTETSDLNNYQTIFAATEGSVAAPTAALHFTNELIDKLKGKQINIHHLTLHVGAGTFMPVKSETMQDHIMHPEYMELNIETINKILTHKSKPANGPLVAVGTTAVRTLESLYWIGLQLHYNQTIDFNGIAVQQWFPYDHNLELITLEESLKAILLYFKKHNLDKLLTRTQIIIAPGYEFKIVDQIITNFHQPQSTLLLLIAAYMGDDWKAMYAHALANNYRFLSYGDGCYLINDKKELT